MGTGETLKSIVTCPFCGHQQEEKKHIDSALYCYECSNCKKLIKPKPGDHCVFNSYGSVPGPPDQDNKNPETNEY